MRKYVLPLVILIAVAAIFFWPILKGNMPFPGDLLINSNPYRSLSVLGYTPGSYPNKAQGKDVITEIYPWKYFEIQELKHGRIPFWNPHNFSGNILMQNLQSAVFNPTNILFFLFSFPVAWTLFIFIQPILASFFFYLFARAMRVGKFAGIVGAIGFAFSSYMSVWIEYGNIAATFAYLPLLLFFLARFLRTKRIVYYAGFILAASVMLLSGYIQGAFYTYVVAICFAIAYKYSNRVRVTRWSLIAISLMFALPLFLVGFQYVSTYQVFLNSTRWPYSLQQFQNLLQPPWYWITFFASDFFGNPAARNYYLSTTYIERVLYIGVPLGIFALYGIWKKRQFSFFFLVLAVIVGILATNLPFVAYFYRLPIPVINTTVPTRMLSIFMFAGVMLATFGIDEFLKKKQFPKIFSLAILSIYALIWAGILLAGKLYPAFVVQIAITKHNVILPTLLMIGTLIAFFLAKKFQKGAMLLLFLLVVFDLLYVFQKITPFAPPPLAYPVSPVMTFIQQHAGINRFWGYGSGYIEPNFQTVDGTYSPEGNDPLHMKTYGDLLESSANGKIPLLPPRPDANLAPGYGATGMNNRYRQTLLNLLGVKYIVQHDEILKDGNADVTTFPASTYQLVWSQSPWQIYENKKALPRFFLANDYIVATGQKALDALYSRDSSKTLVLPISLPVMLSKSATGEATLISYGSQKIVFKTQTTDTMLLFLSDTYFPSWLAHVDNTQTTVYLADYTFRAVIVPKGAHTVTMYYQPQYFVIGMKVTIIACIIFLLSIAIFKKYEKKI